MSSNGFKFTSLCFYEITQTCIVGIASVMYFDDCYVQAETFDMCLENNYDTVNILENLGFVINREKSMTVPIKR